MQSSSSLLGLFLSLSLFYSLFLSLSQEQQKPDNDVAAAVLVVSGEICVKA